MPQPITEISREKLPISGMPEAQSIIRRFEQLRQSWPKRITYGINDEPMDPDRDRNFYPGATLATFQRILPEQELQKVDQSDDSLPYMVYQVEQDEREFIGSIMGISCPRYYRIYLQTPDGVILQNCGEYSKSLNTTQILNLGA